MNVRTGRRVRHSGDLNTDMEHGSRRGGILKCFCRKSAYPHHFYTPMLIAEPAIGLSEKRLNALKDTIKSFHAIVYVATFKGKFLRLLLLHAYGKMTFRYVAQVLH